MKAREDAYRRPHLRAGKPGIFIVPNLMAIHNSHGLPFFDKLPDTVGTSLLMSSTSIALVQSVRTTFDWYIEKASLLDLLSSFTVIIDNTTNRRVRVKFDGNISKDIAPQHHARIGSANGKHILVIHDATTNKIICEYAVILTNDTKQAFNHKLILYYICNIEHANTYRIVAGIYSPER